MKSCFSIRSVILFVILGSLLTFLFNVKVTPLESKNNDAIEADVLNELGETEENPEPSESITNNVEDSLIVSFESIGHKEQYLKNLIPEAHYSSIDDLSILLESNNLPEEKRAEIAKNIDSLAQSNSSEVQSNHVEVFEEILLERELNVKATYQPNFIYSPQVINSNDLFRTNQWGLDNTGQTVNGTPGVNDADIDFPEVYNIANYQNLDEVIVAVIDTGVNYLNEDLVGQMWDGSNCVDENNIAIVGGCIHGYDYGDNDNDPLPRSGDTYSDHGTHIAGVIAGENNNSVGILGIYPKAKIMAIKSNLTTSEIAQAIDFATNNGAKVINASWGGYLGQSDAVMKNAIASFPGLFVTAAGNYSANNDTKAFYPCNDNVDNIICVGSTDQNDNLSYFSNYGTSNVDIAAPGSNIYSSLATTTSSTPFYENFESFTPPAVGGNYNNVSGTWVTVDEAGNNVLKPTATVPYPKNQNVELRKTNPIDLSIFDDAEITLTAKCDTEYNTAVYTDYLSLQASGNNGSSFTEILRIDEVILDYFKSDDLNEGNHGGIIQHDLTGLYIPSNLLTSEFTFRFIWISDSDTNTGETGYGCSVDNITILGYNFLNNAYGYLGGTSMATPSVVGVAAHIWGSNSNLETSDVKNIILNSADIKTSLNNKIQGSRRLNLSNANNAIYIPQSFDLITQNNYITTSTTPSVSWGASANYTSSLTYDIYLNGVLSASNLTSTSYTFSPALSQGVYSWYVIAKNDLNNTRQSNSTRNFTIDTTPPNPFTPTASVNLNKAVITFSATDNLSGISNYQISLNGGGFTNVSSPYTTPVLADGSYSAKVRSYDGAGNFREQTVNFTINYRPVYLVTKGDFNKDGKVNISDLSILASNWLKPNNSADANSDGVTNISDLSILAVNWNGTF